MTPHSSFPSRTGLYFELLRTAGAIRTQENTAVADPSKRLTLAPSDALQACSCAGGGQTEAQDDGLGNAQAEARVRKTRGNRPTGCGLPARGP